MHHHEHEHEHGCCCGHHHEHEPAAPAEGLNEEEQAFLHELEHHHYLPVVRFLVESSKEENFCGEALAPVYLRGPKESMQWVKQTGKLLLDLEEKGYLTLDYGYPLQGYSYEEYKNSELYAYFCETVEQAKGRHGFLGDTPVLELGSIAPVK